MQEVRVISFAILPLIAAGLHVLLTKEQVYEIFLR